MERLSSEPLSDREALIPEGRETPFVSSYGNPEQFQDHLLEQYKLYIEMTDRIASRRIQLNNFNVTILSSLLAFIVILSEQEVVQFQEPRFQAFLIFSVGLLGVALCLVWYLGIQSIGRVRASRFKVIKEMEKHLPFPCWAKERAYYKADLTKDGKRAITSTKGDSFLPIILSLPYLYLTVSSLIKLFSP